LEEERRNRKVIAEVFKMGIRSGKENTEVFRERGNTEGETENQSREADVGI